MVALMLNNPGMKIFNSPAYSVAILIKTLVVNFFKPGDYPS